MILFSFGPTVILKRLLGQPLLVINEIVCWQIKVVLQQHEIQFLQFYSDAKKTWTLNGCFYLFICYFSYTKQGTITRLCKIAFFKKVIFGIFQSSAGVYIGAYMGLGVVRDVMGGGGLMPLLLDTWCSFGGFIKSICCSYFLISHSLPLMFLLLWTYLH